MAYTIFNKRMGRISVPAIGITRYARFNFNKGITQLLKEKGANRVLLLWDEDNLKVGLRPLTPGNKDLRAYDVAYTRKDSSSSISAKTFLDWINYNYTENHSFSVEWNEKQGIFEIGLSPEVFKDKKEPPLKRAAIARRRR